VLSEVEMKEKKTELMMHSTPPVLQLKKELLQEWCALLRAKKCFKQH
jgi:hypothetical protein